MLDIELDSKIKTDTATRELAYMILEYNSANSDKDCWKEAEIGVQKWAINE